MPLVSATHDSAWSTDSTGICCTTLYNPEDLLMSALGACHMLSYLAVCAQAHIAVRSYEDAAVGTVARRDGKVRFVDVLLRPKVVLDPGSDVEKARALHEKAHNISVIVNSVNFPVRHGG